jgi:hypothetical protein
MEFPINRFAFPVTARWNDIAFTEEEQVLLSEPSGLNDVLMCSNWNQQTYRCIDFAGTTNEEAIKKILIFYSHGTYRRLIGNRTTYNGFHVGDKGYPILSLE